MNFKNFCENNTNSDNFEQKAKIKIEKQEQTKINKEKIEDFNQMYNRYKNLSGDELMKQFLYTANEMKRSGNLDKKQIENLYNVLYPMLSSDQKSKLNELIKLI